MTGKELKEIRTSKGYTQKEFAALLGVPLKSYQNWEQDRYPLPPLLDRAVKGIRSKDNKSQS